MGSLKIIRWSVEYLNFQRLGSTTKVLCRMDNPMAKKENLSKKNEGISTAAILKTVVNRATV